MPPSIFVYSNKTFYNGSTTAQELKLTPEYYHVKDFKLKSGAVIEDLKIEYAILATPKKDGQGNIINAVVFCHGFGSRWSSCPSISVLGPKFPKYTIADIISAQYFLVTQHLNIKHLTGEV